jgi:hypothetical protein
MVAWPPTGDLKWAFWFLVVGVWPVITGVLAVRVGVGLVGDLVAASLCGSRWFLLGEFRRRPHRQHCRCDHWGGSLVIVRFIKRASGLTFFRCKRSCHGFGFAPAGG